MADFSELCPLFNTGVFRDLLFPNVKMTDITACGNALVGTAMASHLGAFSFGRTVIVTGCLVRARSAPVASQSIWLQYRTSQTACATTFGTMWIAGTATEEVLTWIPMTIATNKTFTSSDILGISVGTGTAADGGNYDFLIRYREK